MCILIWFKKISTCYGKIIKFSVTNQIFLIDIFSLIHIPSSENRADPKHSFHDLHQILSADFKTFIRTLALISKSYPQH